MSNNKNDLNLLKTFCKVAELGSFSKAAVALKQPKSRVSRAISRLETDVKTTLIRRTTRSMTLTDQGQQFFEKLNPIMQNLSLEIQRLDAQSDEVSGPIRITSADDIAQFLLGDVIADFSKLYPKTRLSLDLSHGVKDLTADSVDVAFRIGKLKDSSYIQKTLMHINLVVVASKEYLNNNPEPTSREDLLDHRVLLIQMNSGPMKLKGLKNSPSKLFTCTNFPMLYQMVKSNFGIGVIPDFYCKGDLENGTVQQLFPDWKIMTTKLHLVYASKKNLPKRVRLFIDHVNLSIKSKL